MTSAFSGSQRDRLLLAVATFGILVLELAVIRWMGSQVRIFAYFNNLVLIAAFLGMGLGVALGRKNPGLVHWALPALAVLALLVTFSNNLGLTDVTFPDTTVSLWGGDEKVALLHFLRNIGIMLALFWIIASVFLFAGAAVGHLFGRIRPLEAYSWDLTGSLLGVIVLTLITSRNLGPPWWLVPGCAALVALSRRPASVVAAVIVIALGWYSARDSTYSAYNRIQMSEDDKSGTRSYIVLVNQDFHQYMHDLSDSAVARKDYTREQSQMVRALRIVYDIPFAISPERSSAVIVGAGTGNDVAAALRYGFQRVYSVDIDGQIIDLGRKYHPEHPYSDPRAVAVVNDARAFFEQYAGPPLDVVCYGLLDSHAMFSAMSTLRLDNYVYTMEGIRSAWEHVAPGGLLSISFSVYAGDWISDRMYWTIAKATGIRPLILDHGLNWGRTFVVTRDFSRLNLASVSAVPRGQPAASESSTRTTSDDWPFLYVRPGQVPWGYIVLLSLVLVTGAVATTGVYGDRLLSGGFHLPLFLMGAAFMLLETRGVTNLSLLFGSTWVVNSAVFAGILTMALLANLLVDRVKPRSFLPWFTPLFLSVLLIWVFRTGSLNHLALLPRGILGGLINALPIGFAGVIVSILLSRSPDPVGALGSNLLGALLGGCLEYLSMWIGMRALAGMALGLYAFAFLLTLRDSRQGKAPPPRTIAPCVE